MVNLYIYVVNIYLLIALRCMHTVLRTKYVRYHDISKQHKLILAGPANGNRGGWDPGRVGPGPGHSNIIDKDNSNRV